EGHLHPGLSAAVGSVKEGGDVLLAIRAGKAVGIGIDDGVNAQSDSGRLGNVLDQLHLLSIETHPIDVIPLAVLVEYSHFFDASGNSIDQQVLSTLSRVDELESLVRVVRWVRRHMVRNGAGVAIVPVGDPGQPPAG